jgi:hypothetical protein
LDPAFHFIGDGDVIAQKARGRRAGAKLLREVELLLGKIEIHFNPFRRILGVAKLLALSRSQVSAVLGSDERSGKRQGHAAA